MTRRTRPALLAGSLLTLALLISSCTVPRPEVTFFGNRTSVHVEAYQWCGANRTLCSLDKSKIARLSMRPDQPLQVNVPSEIAATIWRVIWTFQDVKTNKATTGSSQYFTDHRLAFTVPAFGTGQVLTKVEVQSLIAGTDENGDLGFAVTSSWDVLIAPRLPPAP